MRYVFPRAMCQVFREYLWSAFFSLVFFFTFMVGSARADVYYVDAVAVAGGDGSSWSAAFQTIGEAMGLAEDGDQVWVREGLYGERVTFSESVSLVGGFAGGETTTTARSIREHPTIIDARGLAGSVVRISTNDCVLDGFVITGGDSSYEAGGVYISGRRIEIRDCVIAGNRSGDKAGGVLLYYGKERGIAIRRCRISGNFGRHGGGVGARFSADGGEARTLLENCIISGNEATAGGGLYCEESVEMYHCLVRSNVAGYAGGFTGGEASVFRNCVFWNNAHAGFASGWAPDVSHCLFDGNDLCDYMVQGGECYTGAANIDTYVGNVSNSREGAPLFAPGTTGTWTLTPVYEEGTNRTCLCDARASFTTQSLVGSIVNPNTGQRLEALIVSNTATTIKISGDVTDFVTSGSLYRLVDDHLLDGSPAIDRGTTETALAFDYDGNPRPGADGLVDIGPYEADPAYGPEDHVPPQTRIQELPRVHTASPFELTWEGGDSFLGIDHVIIYYSFNDGPWTLYRDDVQTSKTLFDASHACGDGPYRFYSVGVDKAGNVEEPPDEADAGTFVATGHAADARVYVRPGGVFPCNGSSWSKACRSISEAVLIAKGHGFSEVWVAEGTYSDSVEVFENVSMRGGFAGTESSLPDYQPLGRTTVIDASEADNGNPAQHAIYGSSLSGLVLEHFTITGGHATGNEEGGGLSLSSADNTCVVRHCVVRGNTSASLDGLAIRITGEGPRFECCVIGENASVLDLTEDDEPSCIRVVNGGVTFEDCLIYEPWRDLDKPTLSAVSANSASVTLRRCKLWGMTQAVGGSYVSVEGCLIYSNRQAWAGGPLFYGGGQFVNCMFAECGEGVLPLIHAYGQSVGLAGCVFVETLRPIVSNQASLSCTNGLFVRTGSCFDLLNSSPRDSDTAKITDTTILYCSDTPLQACGIDYHLRNCVFAWNPGPVVVERNMYYHHNFPRIYDPSMYNCLFFSNEGGDYWQDDYDGTMTPALFTGAYELNSLAQGTSNCQDGRPSFQQRHAGMWTADCDFSITSITTTCHDGLSGLTPGALVGELVLLSPSTNKYAYIMANDAESITFAGDQREYGGMGGGYQIVRFEPGFGSNAIDTGTTTDSTPSDLYGTGRPIDVPGYGADGTGEEYDIGVAETQATGAHIAFFPMDSPARFGTVYLDHPPTTPTTVHIVNQGFSDLEFSGSAPYSLEGPDADSFEFAGTLSNATLSPGTTHTVQLRFVPRDLGHQHAFLTVQSNCELGPQLRVPLHALVEAAYTPTPTSTPTPTPTATVAPHFDYVQHCLIESSGEFFAGCFNYDVMQWTSSVNAGGSVRLPVLMPTDAWAAVYLYDYATYRYAGAYYYLRNPLAGPLKTPTPTPPGSGVPEMVSLPATTFAMGCSDSGDDAYGGYDEIPRHEVSLSAYQIGRYEVTNQQYADILNWAYGRGLLEDYDGGPYAGGYVFLDSKCLVEVSGPYCQIQFDESYFSCGSRRGADGQLHHMGDHPANEITWYGAVAYCNWLSEREGLTPCYTLKYWELMDADLLTSAMDFHNGYRLPTEAEWECAAGWDGSRHWVYPFTTDTLTNYAWCNHAISESGYTYVNPMGFDYPPTVPVGWYDGTPTSPVYGWLAKSSVSPTGTYGMAGNIAEWCHDYYASDYYEQVPMDDNPIGPSEGYYRVLRGGSFRDDPRDCRTAARDYMSPTAYLSYIGFRVARSNSSGAFAP